MKDRRQKGLDGERIAAEYLEAQGYHLLEHRYRFGHKEIDLIARKGDLVIFVEVKSRRSDSFGPANLSITDCGRRGVSSGKRIDRGRGTVSLRCHPAAPSGK